MRVYLHTALNVNMHSANNSNHADVATCVNLRGNWMAFTSAASLWLGTVLSSVNVSGARRGTHSHTGGAAAFRPGTEKKDFTLRETLRQYLFT